ncbi:16S rRNA (uracil(1498)-N(3))-methyltransferase [Aldersonia sp. NBC_00410]|uniref:16S rRNA (uracil(1498)-N(3))-methyltransferase n=1 Tax=Aldersonia sp. NBC_00410 TaxID=2975954 RepID=UPI00225A4519|nr:16S rRNA (uracil(1498)-N(3))-methyltransferase [Aldersonia sp. NBC_00410]MCX5042723.1 16S rRNA (uracil(1498)-N(3))-methyltransferase [Aldersonia sp. NBC_00410]
MAATLFYLDTLPPVGAVAVLDGKEGHHAATVRRIGVGERITLSDGHGDVAETTVTAASRDRLDLTVLARSQVEPPTPRVTLVQALPKSDRSELAVELATEAGIDAIVPWQAARCVARWDGVKTRKGVDKWRAAALSAARQSRRAHIPEVADLHDTAAVCALVRDRVATGGLALALHESAEGSLARLDLAEVPDVLLVVGPEGGLDDTELDKLAEAGARAVLLGPSVLRTSTAAAVALGALGALTERWCARPLH